MAQWRRKLKLLKPASEEECAEAERTKEGAAAAPHNFLNDVG